MTSQKDYVFSSDWLSHNIPLWRATIGPLAGRACFVDVSHFQHRLGMTVARDPDHRPAKQWRSCRI